MVLQGIIFGPPKNLSIQGSLKNHLVREFFKEPTKVSQGTFKMVPQLVTVLPRTTKPLKEPFKIQYCSVCRALRIKSHQNNLMYFLLAC